MNEKSVIKLAKMLYDLQNDISYCQQETNIYFIGSIETAIKFLKWISNKNIFEYKFKN